MIFIQGSFVLGEAPFVPSNGIHIWPKNGQLLRKLIVMLLFTLHIKNLRKKDVKNSIVPYKEKKSTTSVPD